MAAGFRELARDLVPETRLICLCDCEADIDELLATAAEQAPDQPHVEYVIRSQFDRTLVDDVAEFPAGDNARCRRRDGEMVSVPLGSRSLFPDLQERLPGLQLETGEHLEPALALYMIIAWRIQSIVMLGRAYPDLPCDVVFDDLEWRTAFVIRHHRPPTAPPSYDHHHRFLRRLFGSQAASRPQGHLDQTTAFAGLCYRANSPRSNQPNLCGMMWVLAPGGTIPGVALGAGRDQATLSVRPEDVHLVSADQAPLTGRISFIRDLGASIEIFVDADGTQIVAVSSPRERAGFQVGDTVGLRLDPEACRVLAS